jgi:hypothetical protein
VVDLTKKKVEEQEVEAPEEETSGQNFDALFDE